MPLFNLHLWDTAHLFCVNFPILLHICVHKRLYLHLVVYVYEFSGIMVLTYTSIDKTVNERSASTGMHMTHTASCPAPISTSRMLATFEYITVITFIYVYIHEYSRILVLTCTSISRIRALAYTSMGAVLRLECVRRAQVYVPLEPSPGGCRPPFLCIYTSMCVHVCVCTWRVNTYTSIDMYK